VVASADPTDQPRVLGIKRSELPEPRHIPFLIPPQEPSLWVKVLHPDAHLPTRTHRQEVPDVDLLQLREDPLRTRLAEVVDPVVAVPASPVQPHLHQPRPDVRGARRDLSFPLRSALRCCAVLSGVARSQGRMASRLHAPCRRTHTLLGVSPGVRLVSTALQEPVVAVGPAEAKPTALRAAQGIVGVGELQRDAARGG
jgi:hypothetical protein